MSNKGYRFVERADRADFTFAYTVGTRDKAYTEGGLAIDVFDRRRESPVWHGVASKRLSRSKLEDTAGNTETINSAVEKILAIFPPD